MIIINSGIVIIALISLIIIVKKIYNTRDIIRNDDITEHLLESNE
jgi:hypothetical protein